MLGSSFIPALKWGSHERITGGALGFAAGVMLYVSFVDILGSEAKELFENHFAFADEVASTLGEEKQENLSVRIWIACFFFVGLAIATLLDIAMSYIPVEERDQNSSAASSSRSLELTKSDSGAGGLSDTLSTTTSDHAVTLDGKAPDVRMSLERVSLVTFVALTLHNIPEGLATFAGGGTGSYTIPFAIAMHNIPEGAAIAIPTYQATGSVWKAVRSTFIAGLAQPAGAALGWLSVRIAHVEDVPDFLYGAMYSVTAGIMVCVSIMELIPEALEAASPRFVGCCTFLGFFVMECSILLLGMASRC
jgi:ZIP family zinc transporter